MNGREQTWRQWVRAIIRDKTEDPRNHPSKLVKGCLAPLTGTDVRVLDAFVPCLKLYAYTGDEELFGVMHLLLKQMQPSTRWIAREFIPFVMNWEDRERLWWRMDPDEQARLGAVGRSYDQEMDGG